MARFVDPTVGIYTLGAVPVHATWGSGAREGTTCVGNSEVAIWALGCLEHIFYDIQQRRKPTLCVKLKLLRECDRVRLAALNRRTCPKSSMFLRPSALSAILTHTVAEDRGQSNDVFVANATIPDPQCVRRSTQRSHLHLGSSDSIRRSSATCTTAAPSSTSKRTWGSSE